MGKRDASTDILARCSTRHKMKLDALAGGLKSENIYLRRPVMGNSSIACQQLEAHWHNSWVPHARYKFAGARSDSWKQTLLGMCQLG